MPSGRIVSCVIYPAKGADGIPMERIRFLEGVGIQGDHFAGRQERQISLLDQDTRRWMAAQTVPGPCFTRFRENILLDGIRLADCTAGEQLQIGTGTLVISSFCKRCFADCPRLRAALGCQLKESIRYAAVVSGGEAECGSEVTRLTGKEPEYT